MSLIVMVMIILQSYTGPMRAEAVAGNGGYQLHITGAMQDVALVCSHMDCGATFPTARDAANAFAAAWGRVNGFPVEPIPPAP